jgi:hypothetical protein
VGHGNEWGWNEFGGRRATWVQPWRVQKQFACAEDVFGEGRRASGTTGVWKEIKICVISRLQERSQSQPDGDWANHTQMVAFWGLMAADVVSTVQGLQSTLVAEETFCSGLAASALCVGPKAHLPFPHVLFNGKQQC